MVSAPLPPHHTFAEIATLLGVDPATVQWAPSGEHDGAVLVRTPWARVMVGRSPAQARAFADAWARGRALWLHEAVCKVYATAAHDGWISPQRVREAATLVGPGAVDFVDWALADPGPHWRSLPNSEVRGAWGVWQDAVLLHRDALWQLRLHPRGDFAQPFPYRRARTSGITPSTSME